MKLKWIASAVVMSAMLVAPVQRAQAGDEFVGGLVGGLIGGAIGSGLANQQRQKATTRTKRVYVAPRATSAQRQEAREVQTALNYFGFDAGVADGVLGRRSRAAISRYQVYMGYPGSGQLSDHEKTLLLGAYHRAVAGGPEVSRTIARSNDGARAVLIAQRDGATGSRTAGYAGLPMAVSQAVDEVANSSDPSAQQLLQRSGFIQLADLNGDGSTDYIIDTALAGSSFWCNAAQCKTMVFASTPNGYSRNDLLLHSPTPQSFDCVGGSCQVRAAPQPQTQPADDQTMMAKADLPDSATTSGLTLPVFNTAPKPKSLSSHCSKISLLTSANGGFTTVSDIIDPDFAIQEQFCLGRTYAVARGETLMEAVQGADPSAIEAQCDAFGTSMTSQIADLTAKPPKAVLTAVSQLILGSGMTPEQLRTTAQICMASGYRTDRMPAALGGALLLTALGARPYGELVGHHLQTGFGTAKNTDRALAWYSLALTALDGGAAPVLAPGQPERVEVLRKAAMGLAGGDMATPVPASTGDATMPVFTLSE